MMTIKLITWTSDGAEITRLLSTSSHEIVLQRWHYTTSKQYFDLLKEKFNTGAHPFITIGDCPDNEDLSRDREFLYGEYYSPEGAMFTFVLNYGWLYVMQEGKTVESHFVHDQNGKTRMANVGENQKEVK